MLAVIADDTRVHGTNMKKNTATVRATGIASVWTTVTGAARRRSGWTLAAGAVLWLACVSAGLAGLAVHANTSATLGTVAARWPRGAGITPDDRVPTLLVFAHPQCACTRATLGELAILMARAQGRVRAHVVMYQPAVLPAGWRETGLEHAATAIPGVQVHADPEGAKSEVFGVFASGHTLVYSPAGTLLFSGGITGARGHSGDNPGRSAIAALLRGSPLPLSRTRIFGCALRHVKV